jgi:predicted GNAT family N-acyltransferase
LIRGKFIAPGGDYGAALALRRAVFSDEQGFDPALDHDAYDDLSAHVLLYDQADGASEPAGDPVATGRLFWLEGEFVIGRVCVRRDRRGEKLGDLVMRMLLYKAMQHNAPSVALGAQKQAVGFYARYGFEPVEEYLDEGVLHVRMRVRGDRINLEGSCHKTQAGGCAHCGGCPEGGRHAEPDGPQP